MSEEAVDHPSHYNTGSSEVIDAIEEWFDGTGFNLGNAVKYLARAPHKGKKEEDLRKAIWYIERELGMHGKKELVKATEPSDEIRPFYNAYVHCFKCGRTYKNILWKPFYRESTDLLELVCPGCHTCIYMYPEKRKPEFVKDTEPLDKRRKSYLGDDRVWVCGKCGHTYGHFESWKIACPHDPPLSDRLFMSDKGDPKK